MAIRQSSGGGHGCNITTGSEWAFLLRLLIVFMSVPTHSPHSARYLAPTSTLSPLLQQLVALHVIFSVLPIAACRLPVPAPLTDLLKWLAAP
eukprot:4242464-Prymnesium_polylepis.2